MKPKRAGKAAFLLAMLVFGWRVVEGHFHLLAGILSQADLLTRTDTRIDGLLWGCLAAIYFPTIERVVARIRFSQLWLVVLAMLMVVQAMHAPGLTLWQAILLPALVLSTVTQPASVLGRILEWQPLRWIGALSYSLPVAGAFPARNTFGDGAGGRFVICSKLHGIWWRFWCVRA